VYSQRLPCSQKDARPSDQSVFERSRVKHTLGEAAKNVADGGAVCDAFRRFARGKNGGTRCSSDRVPHVRCSSRGAAVDTASAETVPFFGLTVVTLHLATTELVESGR